MLIRKTLIVAAGMIVSSATFAADYRSGYYVPRNSPPVVYAAPAYVPYVSYVPPVYYEPSPLQYVQDLRTGAPGHWVQLKPSLLDRIFGELNDGY
jgi:hypothetical protein